MCWLGRLFKSKKKDCKDYSKERLAYHKDRGERARICQGWYDDSPHMWVEYLKGDKWIVDDRAVHYKGDRNDHYKLKAWIENGTVGTT